MPSERREFHTKTCASKIRLGYQLTHFVQWDRCLSSVLIRSSLGLSFGIVASVLLFRRRAWPAWIGLGFGAGRAWEECDNVRLEIGILFYAVMLTKFLVIQARCCTDEGWLAGAPSTVEVPG